MSPKLIWEEPLGPERQPVECAARDLVSRHSHFHGRGDLFQFKKRGDVLVIEGTVPSFYLKQMLQYVLQNLQSIRRIENRVRVISSDGVSDRPESPYRLDG